MSTSGPSPIHYAMPVPRARLFSWSVFITSAILCWGLIAFCVVAVPHFKQIYQNFHLQLPAVSQLLLFLGDFVTANFGWAFLLLLPFALALVLRRLTLRSRWARLVILLFFFALIIGPILALFMPMISLIEGISKR